MRLARISLFCYDVLYLTLNDDVWDMDLSAEGRFKMESSVDACTDKLVKSILESRAYRRFIKAQKALEQYPGLKEKINKYRTDIFKLYEDGVEDDIINTSDILEKKFQSMQKIPEVNAYLDAETEICRMVREIYQRLISETGVEEPEN